MERGEDGKQEEKGGGGGVSGLLHAVPSSSIQLAGSLLTKQPDLADFYSQAAHWEGRKQKQEQEQSTRHKDRGEVGGEKAKGETLNTPEMRAVGWGLVSRSGVFEECAYAVTHRWDHSRTSSSKLDQAGERLSSLDWLSVSQPVAILIHSQVLARPSHHQIKCGAGSQQGHYLAPNLSSGTALKGCLCLGLMRKAQDAMSEGNNQHGPFITLAACAPGQGPPAHFCGDEIYDKPLSEAESRQQSSNTHRPPGIL
ncbi:unnamed protein product [Pleuronectes platessa]|uniref:Uncharacterized protein n=1 Tax=Pleuronectes platessa TaxID=8262 RepID=A0A9N7Z6B8_PLEPL|nr:unnamed protein product [Pleuronectes platessa]